MVAVTLNIYDKFREGGWDGNHVNVETPGGNGIKAALVTNSHVPAQATDDFFDDIDNEVTGSNYTQGGNVMSTGTVTIDGAGLVTVDIGDPAAWSQHASGFTDARRVIIYLDTGTDSTSRLIAYSDAFAADQSLVDGDVTVTVNASGLWTQAR